MKKTPIIITLATLCAAMSPWLSAAAVSSFTDGVGTGQWTDAGN